MDTVDERNINEMELWPVVASVKGWGSLAQGLSLKVVTDNQSVYHMLRSGRSSNTHCMTWLRELFWVCVTYNILIEPFYIRSCDNIVADTLSHLPYPDTSSKAESLLSPFKLCCELDLFDLCRNITRSA